MSNKAKTTKSKINPNPKIPATSVKNQQQPTMKFLKVYLKSYTYFLQTNNLKHLGIYLILLSYRNTYSNICIPPLEEIASFLNIALQQLNRHIKSLEDNQAIIVEKKEGKKYFFFPVEELIEKKSTYPMVHETPTPQSLELFFEQSLINSNTFVKIYNSMIQKLIKENSIHLVTVYVRLLLHKNYINGECFPSVRTLGEETKMSPTTIVKHLKELEDLGYIKVKKGYNKVISSHYAFPFQDQEETKNSKNRKEKTKSEKEKTKLEKEDNSTPVFFPENPEESSSFQDPKKVTPIFKYKQN